VVGTVRRAVRRRKSSPKPKVLKRGRIKRVKQSKMGRRLDKRRKALPPGKRRSKSGRVYYERRSNHAD